MKNILIPTDFSINARNALQYALSYFGDIAVNFYILHVDNADISKIKSEDGFLLTLDKDKQTSTKKLLQKEVDFCKKSSENPTHNFVPLFSDQSLVEAVRECISKKEIEYIVMGTRGASKTLDNKIGSFTYEIISKVKCPTIIVPSQAIYYNFKNIALLTDYNNWDKNKMFVNLYETLIFKKVNLQILQIHNKHHGWTHLQADTKDFLIDLLRRVDYKLYSLTNEDIDLNIQYYITKLDIDMVALVGRNINFVQQLLFQPKPEDITYRLKVPFLILHD
ncbi:MAG TPA: universal stress protein [Flavobacteriaceae bacterium]|nr:universal stress protein [Flavobacteriaceae bacterium]